ncbi:MAG TPA: hypothetical protein VHF88_05870 [Thermoleophilaceae bacterium]|nr:hypothetical protein [Thermoleophilaceae bacterium]
MSALRHIRRSYRLTLLLVVTCAGAGVLASCGGGSGADEDEIRTTVRELQRAFVADQPGRVCGLLSRAARKHIRAMGHDLNPEASPPCDLDLYMFTEGIRKSPTWRERSRRPIDDIEIDGDRATAAVAFEDGRTAGLPFVREDGRWRVDALFGAIPAGQQEDNY